MATYNFASATQADASKFTANDYLVFVGTDSLSSATGVSVALVGATGGQASSISLTFEGKTLTFPSALATASQSTAGATHLIFDDQSQLLLGNDTTTAETLNINSTATGAPSVAYGFAGNDTFNLGTGGTAYIYGGSGADIIGSATANGNYVIYGNAPGTFGQADGGDTIIVGSGANIINGNAGADKITVGTDATTTVAASTGINYVQGGQDIDTITIHGGGANLINGNLGADIIDASSATGDNLLRGGKDGDTITAGQGNDTVLGDLGDDTLIVGGSATHVTTLTGGAGADTFNFTALGAGNSSVGYQTITDFTVGTDHIDLAALPTNDVGHSTTVFSTVEEAQTYAAGLATAANGSHSVSALSVGTADASSTYVFYQESATVTGVIHLSSVTDSSTITGSDFI